jgi:hypothetical protein
MRHYDRSEFRHLDDAQRYRDHEYKADDGWVGPNEHSPEAGWLAGTPPPEAWEMGGTPPLHRAQPSEWHPPRRRRLREVSILLRRFVEALRHPGDAARQFVSMLIGAIAQPTTRARRT